MITASTATPSAIARRRRTCPAWCSRCSASRLASRKSRSVRLRSGSWRVAPLQRAGEARAAVEVADVASGVVPLTGGVGEAAVQAPALGVVLQPAAQSWPFAQQGVVRELDGAGADREQALVGEDGDDLGDSVVVELGQRDPPALDRAAGVLGGEPQEHAARERLLVAIEPCEGVLGVACDRAAHAPGGLICGQPQPAPVAPLPQLEQRGREHRQRARLVLDVAHQRIGELGFHAQADPLRGALHRAA